MLTLNKKLLFALLALATAVQADTTQKNPVSRATVTTDNAMVSAANPLAVEAVSRCFKQGVLRQMLQ